MVEVECAAVAPTAHNTAANGCERLEMVCRRAGLRRIRWHDPRHSFASQLATAGVPLRQIQA